MVGTNPDRLLRMAAQREARGQPSALAVGAVDAELDSDNPHHIGARASWVPALGELTWDLSSTESKRTSLSARSYQTDEGRSIGYIRLSHYSIDDATVDQFRFVVTRFNDATDAMVLDQTNNPGGSLLHAYAVLSHLTDQELLVPKHRWTIDDDAISEAEEAVWVSEAEGPGDPNEWPTPEIVTYSRFVLAEAEAGRTLTNPGYIFGVETVKPSTDPYTNPVVVLINGFTFSAPEYIAAIIQDAGRGKLFGKRTAGAGGLMRMFPGNSELIKYFTLTWATAIRPNGEIIEGIGVHPDIEYSPTADDIRGEYQGYRDALLEAINTEMRAA